jgi:NAD(P)-dependent dehydrogenase (short-subunit alcohol dehydrogenase family)
MRLMVSQCGQTICKLSGIWLLVGTPCLISRLRSPQTTGAGHARRELAARILALVKTVLVTGANRGLGLEFARQYAADGWNVLAGCRKPSKAQALQRLSQDMKGKLTLVEIDVTDARSVKRAAAEVGEGAVDVLINCAGVMGKSDQTIGTIDYGDWAQVLDVNVMGPARVTEAFLERVVQSSSRAIVTITSGMGSIADNTSGGYVPYRTSKAAVNMVMRSAAIDLARQRVICVVINPGWVKTDMGGPGATLTPEQSVTAMRRVIGRLGPKDSGKFYNYDGHEYPW